MSHLLKDLPSCHAHMELGSALKLIPHLLGATKEGAATFNPGFVTPAVAADVAALLVAASGAGAGVGKGVATGTGTAGTGAGARAELLADTEDCRSADCGWIESPMNSCSVTTPLLDP